MKKSKYFTAKEMKCKHCGKLIWNQDFMEWLDVVRHECDFPFIINSGYRCLQHPEEIHKDKPGAHTTGRAVDIAVKDGKAIKVIEAASRHGCKRVGVCENSFIHLDMSDLDHHYHNLWTY